MIINTKTLPPIAKHILGAAVGAVAALVLYGVYDIASPYLPEISFGVSPEAEEVSIHGAAPGKKWHRVIELARRNLREGQ